MKAVSQSHALLRHTEDWKIRILIKWCTLTTGGHWHIWQEILFMGNHTQEDDLVQALFSECQVSKSKWGQIPLHTWRIIFSSESVKCTKTPQHRKERDGRTSHMLHPVQIPQISRFAFCTRPRMTPSSYVTTCLWCLSLTPANHVHTEEGGVPVK